MQCNQIVHQHQYFMPLFKLSKWYSHNFLWVALLALTACQNNQKNVESFDKAAEVKAITQMCNNMAYDVTFGGPSAWLNYLEKSSSSSTVINGELLFKSYAAAQIYFLDPHRYFNRQVKLRLDSIQVELLEPSIASIRSAFFLKTFDKKGKAINLKGYWTAVGHKKEQVWMINTAHWSSEAVK